MTMSIAESTQYKIRPYRRSDHSSLKDICAHVYGGSDYLPQMADSYLLDSTCSFLSLTSPLSADGDKIMAVANLRRLPAQKIAWVEAVRTHPDHRNQGLATTMLRSLVDLARGEEETISSRDLDTNNNQCDRCGSRNRTRILTCTVESNTGMRRTLEKVGFVKCNTITTLNFSTLRNLPGWKPNSTEIPIPLISALDLNHLISPAAIRLASSSQWTTIYTEDELISALRQCEVHGKTCGYLPGLYEYIVPGPSRADLRRSLEHGLVFTLDIAPVGKEISGCDESSDPKINTGKAILAFVEDERISSLRSKWVCSIVAYTAIAFEAAVMYAHSPGVSKILWSLHSSTSDMTQSGTAPPFCLVFDDALPLDEGTLAHALPRVTDRCLVFSHNDDN